MLRVQSLFSLAVVIAAWALGVRILVVIPDSQFVALLPMPALHLGVALYRPAGNASGAIAANRVPQSNIPRKPPVCIVDECFVALGFTDFPWVFDDLDRPDSDWIPHSFDSL